MIRLGFSGGCFRILQHQGTLAEPTVHGAPVGNEEGQGDQHEHGYKGKQCCADTEQLPAAVKCGNFQDNTADARHSEAGNERFQHDEAGAQHEADDHDEIQRELIHTESSFPFISLILLYTVRNRDYSAKREK